MTTKIDTKDSLTRRKIMEEGREGIYAEYGLKLEFLPEKYAIKGIEAFKADYHPGILTHHDMDALYLAQYYTIHLNRYHD
jgi:hypothetical protein